ncbi:transcriptional regulator TbsP [Halorubrum vacuolatum]|nr:DUF5821 family protein [Halorubrum vacuolatum]
MESERLGTDVEEMIDAASAEADDGLLVVDPSPETVVSIIEAGSKGDGLPATSVLADRRALKGVMDDFLIASKAADLIDAGALTLRIQSNDAENSLFISTERVLALVGTDGGLTALASDDDDFVSEVSRTYHGAFEDAAEYPLRTPPLTRVRETMAAELGEATRDDFDRMLGSLGTVGGNGDGLDEVTASLLVAAKNDVLLYDVSKWGEDVGIASKATFSRTKTRLEDLGLIDTEKVPIDVGRPRLRLKIGDERLIGLDAGELATNAAELLD